MNKFISAIASLVIIIWLSGCDLSRPDDIAGDISTGPTPTIITRLGCPGNRGSGGRFYP
ncbi:MAG: hypothetical protein U0401_08105 [Anaerolineae bacterium]